MALKDKLTPFHERLDPESTFYKHYMQKQDVEKLIEIVKDKAAEDSQVLSNVALRLGPKPKEEEMEEQDPTNQMQCGLDLINNI